MSRKKGMKQLKNGHCDQCLQYGVLSHYHGEYLCRDCFVGDYDEEYVQQRLQALIRGESPLARAQKKEDGNAFRFERTARKGRR